MFGVARVRFPCGDVNRCRVCGDWQDLHISDNRQDAEVRLDVDSDFLSDLANESVDRIFVPFDVTAGL